MTPESGRRSQHRHGQCAHNPQKKNCGRWNAQFARTSSRPVLWSQSSLPALFSSRPFCVHLHNYSHALVWRSRNDCSPYYKPLPCAPTPPTSPPLFLRAALRSSAHAGADVDDASACGVPETTRGRAGAAPPSP